MSENRSAFTRGVVWNFADSIGSQLVSFVVSVILARLLNPENYGLLAIVFVFTSFFQIIISGGLSEALIMKQEKEWKTINSVFWYNLAVSIFFYFLLFLFAPIISDYYSEPLLKNVLRVAGLTMPLWSLSNIQFTILYKNVDFKKMFLLKVPGLLLSSVVGIVCAYAGLGVWALIFQLLSLNAINSLLAFVISPFKPGPGFEYKRIRELFSISGGFVASGLINKIFDNLYPLLIGKIYTMGSLGLYNRANATKDILVNNLVQVIAKVGFPVFATMKDDPEKLREAYRRVIQVTFFIVAPVMLGGIVCAGPLIHTVYSEKWIATVPYFRVCCLIGLTFPFHVINLDILKVYARSGTFLKLEIIKKFSVVIALLLTYRYGIMALLWGQVVVNVFSAYINSYYSGRIISYTLLNQLKDVLPVFLPGMAMVFAIVFLSKYVALQSQQALLFTQLLLGCVVYVAASWLFGVKPFLYLLSLVKKRKADD